MIDRPWRATLWLTLGVALLHLAVAGRVGLSADEAHYALYGLHLDWSYFDHPPLVGWLQALILPLSQSEFALRLWPIVLGAATPLVLYRFALRLFPYDHPWLGFWSVVFYHSGLLFQILGMALVPETPLLLLALLAMVALLRALDGGRLSDWLGFGLALGLAGLSKYTAVTLVLTAVLFVILQRRLDVLRGAGPWLAMLLALVLIAPVFYWNMTHDWLSFRYQLEHGYRATDWSWTRVGISQLAQFFAYAPGIYLFGLIALVASRHEWRERGVQLMLLLVLPVLLLFASASGREETLPHWTALVWAGLAPLAARWILRHWPTRAVRVACYVSLGYSLVLIALLYSLLFHPWLPFPHGKNPLAPLTGWPAAAKAAATERAALAAEPGPEPVLFVPNWALASRLAWYARPLPVQVTDDRFDQFDLWYGSPAPGARGVLVMPAGMRKLRERALAGFERCRALPVVTDGNGIVTFELHVCRGYRGTPGTESKEEPRS